MSILVTGGAGYIGSHIVRELLARGNKVVIVDDLASGTLSRAQGAKVLQCDLSEPSSQQLVEEFISEEGVKSVIHLAARKRADESVRRPAWYFQQNVGGLSNLLLAMENCDVRKLIFSSSAGVYSASDEPIVEDGRLNPANPYGETKLIGEWLVRDATKAWGLKAISLRYFNVAGAGSAQLVDTGRYSLVQMVLERISNGQPPLIFGGDYRTPDGTCVRDFVHVQDVAEAHLRALDSIDDLPESHTVFNIGTGHGASVLTVAKELLRLSNSNLEPEIVARRLGDEARVVASVDKIKEQLGWRSRFDLDAILVSSWEAWKQNSIET